MTLAESLSIIHAVALPEPMQSRADRGLEEALTAAVRAMVLRSPRLMAHAGGPDAALEMLNRIENVWLEHGGLRVHLDLHRSDDARATIVFQPG